MVTGAGIAGGTTNMLPLLLAFAAGFTLASLYHSARALIAERKRLRLQLRRELAREFRYTIRQYGQGEF
jgi:cell division protein FtsL